MRWRFFLPGICVHISGAHNFFFVAFDARSAAYQQIAEQWLDGQKSEFIRMDALRCLKLRNAGIATRRRVSKGLAQRLQFCMDIRGIFRRLQSGIVEESLVRCSHGNRMRPGGQEFQFCAPQVRGCLTPGKRNRSFDTNTVRDPRAGSDFL